jgi:ABC-type bacteriocin/lantibiotic exporter with double-glycine peptidase domain
VRTSTRLRPALALLLGAGCGAALFEPYRPGSLAPDAALLNVPLVRQEHERSCGFAAASMLFQYYDQPVGEADRELLLREPESADGVTGRALQGLLERNGFRAQVFAGELFDGTSPRGVLYHLRRGRPLVAMLSVDGPRRHYVVVSGLDTLNGIVVIVDPAKGVVACRAHAFLDLWEQGNRFALLAVPADLGSREDGRPAPR